MDDIHDFKVDLDATTVANFISLGTMLLEEEQHKQEVEDDDPRNWAWWWQE